MNIAEMIEKLNKLACRECPAGEFVTLFYAVIDVNDMTVTYCNCGHEPTLLLHDDKLEELETGGLVLGVDCKAEYKIEKKKLSDGSSLLFYTDGLVDAANFDGEFWGRERFLETVRKCNRGTAAHRVKNILQYRRRFVGLAQQFDDTSLVIVNADRRAEPDFMK